jgi:subtilase family serine protease
MNPGFPSVTLRIASAVCPLLVVVALLFPVRVASQSRAAIIVGNHPSGTLLGQWQAAPPDLQLQMTAVLALHNTDELEVLKKDLQQPGSPNYRRWLTSAEFARRFGPTAREMGSVTGWLSANG